MRKRIPKLLLCLLISLYIIVNNNILSALAMPELPAQGVFLMDGISGQVLYEKNADTQYEPASTTKVMTAILTLEKCNLQDKVTIGQTPTLVDGSAIGVREGEIYTVEELLLGLLLESGNDCAEALAEHISGSVSEFAKLMTERAKELGATHTVFKNPSGLHDEGHLSTARDLALILKFALNQPEFIRISRELEYKYESHPFSDGSEKWAINRNNCYVDWSPFYYDKLYTGKTGYTPEANHTYVAAAKNNDRILIGSFLNAEDKYAHYSSVGPLFDWAFENFKTKKIINKGEKIAELEISPNEIIPLLSDRDVYYTFSPTENIESTHSVSYDNVDLSKSTIKELDPLLDGKIQINGKDVSTVKLLSGVDREYTTGVFIEKTIQTVSTNKYLIILVILIIIFCIYLLVCICQNIIRQRKFRNKYKNIYRPTRRYK